LGEQQSCFQLGWAFTFFVNKARRGESPQYSIQSDVTTMRLKFCSFEFYIWTLMKAVFLPLKKLKRVLFSTSSETNR
jgi:hypothetical protein